MGKPMASNLMKRGFSLAAYDIRKEAVEELAGYGASSATSSKEVAETSDIVITMLPSSPNVEEVYLGKDGVLEGVRKGAIAIDMSTIAPSTTKRVGKFLSEKGVRMIDAPVARTVKAAVEGKLAIFVGGEKAVFEECRAILEAMGTDIYYAGGLGSGEVVKIVNNLILAAIVCATSEGLVLGAKAGVKPDVLFETLNHGSASSFALQNHFKNFALKGDFREGLFSVEYMLKDLSLALGMGKEFQVPLLLGSLVSQFYESVRATGKGKNYYPVVMTLLEDLTGVKVRMESES